MPGRASAPSVGVEMALVGEDRAMTLTGPARKVFEGVVDTDWLEGAN